MIEVEGLTKLFRNGRRAEVRALLPRWWLVG